MSISEFAKSILNVFVGADSRSIHTDDLRSRSGLSNLEFSAGFKDLKNSDIIKSTANGELWESPIREDYDVWTSDGTTSTYLTDKGLDTLFNKKD